MGSKKARTFRKNVGVTGEEASVALGPERRVVVTSSDRAATVRVRAASGRVELEMEIVLTANGPVIRARAAGLELEASGRIEARCAEFVVDAAERVEIRSGGHLLQQAAGEATMEADAVDVHARSRGVRVRANDDVQLLGEHVLLNCDPSPQVPAWVPLATPQPRVATLPAEVASGDPALLLALGVKR